METEPRVRVEALVSSAYLFGIGTGIETHELFFTTVAGLPHQACHLSATSGLPHLSGICRCRCFMAVFAERKASARIAGVFRA